MLPAFYLVDVAFRDTATKLYTYRVPAKWGVKVGNKLVVNTQFGDCVVTVHKTTATSQHPTGHYNHKWATAKVDTKDYEEVQRIQAQLSLERVIHNAIEQAKHEARLSLLKEMVDNDPHVSVRARELLRMAMRAL